MSKIDREIKLKFIKNKLPNLIKNSNEELKNHKINSIDVELSTQLDGFMSSIFIVNLKTEYNEQIFDHPMIVKLMKGSYEFRVLSKGYPQFENEITIYSKVIPVYNNFLQENNIFDIQTIKWIPKVYFADYGSYPELSEYPESILAVENLKYKNYKMGPRLDLDEDHLKKSIKILAEYHSITYAMRILNDKRLEILKQSIIPLPFENSDGTKNLYDINYGVGVERFLEFYDRSPEYHIQPYSKYIENFRKNYKEKILKLLTKLYNDDLKYSVILHGDYNRNNLLYKYDEIKKNVIDVKMFDFQEVRYGSPALDLSFLMFFNMNPENHKDQWDNLIKEYNEIILNSLCCILKTNLDDPRLEDYKFNNFNEHFKKFGFYGVMICIHFLPWIMCNEEECDKVSKLFEQDMLGQEFKDYIKIVGGDDPNKRMMDAFKLAVVKGYADVLQE